MRKSPNWNCWDIMSCNEIDCPARNEPETPCWEIAKRIGDYRSTSNTCKECIVYLLKDDASSLSPGAIKQIIDQKKLQEDLEQNYLLCPLQANS